MADSAPPQPGRPPFGRLLVAWLLIGGPLALAGALMVGLGIQQARSDTAFLLAEDLPVLPLVLLIVGGLALLPPLLRSLPAIGTKQRRIWLFALAALVLAFGALGSRLLFGGYLFSLDEFLANFDATIFAHGQLMAPTPLAWRPFVPALQPIYMLQAPGDAAWSSSYLPLNAALRALAMKLGAQGLVNPLLSAAAVVAVYGVARQLWPARPSLALGAAALLATSSQCLITAATAYAMPAHLALNLIWLWLFLRGGYLGHGGALAVAFIATGLHQVAFHPLFAAPFILQLWLDRRWAVGAIYTLAYAAIVAFWVSYWAVLFQAMGVAQAAASHAGAGLFVQRALDLIGTARPSAIGAMVESLFRFVTWQNPLTAPLVLVSVTAAVRAKGVMRALAVGVALTILAMMLLVPSQTHGWGYRYLHGLMGSIVLLAIWSWSRLTDALTPAQRSVANGGFVVACAASLLVLLPARAWQAWSYVRPYAAANAAIQSAPDQVVLVDNQQPWFDMGAVVRNDPYLARGPKVMVLAALSEDQLTYLCQHDSVGFFDGTQAASLGVDTLVAPIYAAVGPLRARMAALNCGRPIVPPAATVRP